MELVPDWAPNIHPMLVHFPIALILGAIGTDLLSLAFRRWDWLRPATVALYVAGGASVVLTYVTGTWAADAVSVPAAAETVLTEHSNLGWWTMWFFAVFALVRLGAHLWPAVRDRVSVRVVLLLIALAGGYLLYQTGDHGAEMVFRYGVGVQKAEADPVASQPGLTIGTAGWEWQPHSDTAWVRRVAWLHGGPASVGMQLDTTRTGGLALELTSDSTVAFVVPDTLGAVRLTVEVDLRRFDGAFQLLHHVHGPKTFDALTVNGRSLDLGRSVDGTWTSFAKGAADLDGWTSLGVVGDGTHFRGYHGNAMVVHGHGDAANPGLVGLRFDGTGTVRLRRLQAMALE